MHNSAKLWRICTECPIIEFDWLPDFFQPFSACTNKWMLAIDDPDIFLTVMEVFLKGIDYFYYYEEIED